MNDHGDSLSRRAASGAGTATATETDTNAESGAGAPDAAATASAPAAPGEDGGSASRRRRRAGSPLVGVLPGLVIGGLLLATVLGFAGRGWWGLDLLSHFRVQYAVVALALLAGALLMRRWVWAAGALAVLAINAALIVPLYVPRAGVSAPPPGGPQITLMHLNVYTDNATPEAVFELLRETDADVVFLQEIDIAWVDAIQASTDLPWDFIRGQPRPDNFGIGMLVRAGAFDEVVEPGEVEVIEPKMIDPTAGRLRIPAVETRLRIEGMELSVLSLHAVPPLNAEYAAARDLQFMAARVWAQMQAAQGRSYVIIGDLNATPWSPVLRGALADGELLVNSQQGFGIQASWPAGGGPLGMIPIDHCLHSPDLVTLARVVGGEVGSDHHPLAVTLAPRGR